MITAFVTATAAVLPPALILAFACGLLKGFGERIGRGRG